MCVSTPAAHADAPVFQPASANPKFLGRVNPTTESAIGAIRFYMGLANPSTGAAVLDLDLGNKKQAAGRPPANVPGIEMKQITYAGMRTWRISPQWPVGKPKVVVAIHGGAFLIPATVENWSTYVMLVQRTGATILVPEYPLIPHGTAARVVPQMAGYLHRAIGDNGAADVSVLGDSAGAGLGLAAVQELVRRGAPVPASMVLVSPWLDLSMTNRSYQANADPTLKPELLRATSKYWAGTLGVRDPRVSPLFGSLRGLPPTYVYSGSRDPLSTDAVRLSRKAATVPGSRILFDLRRNEIHNFAMLPYLPDGVDAQMTIGAQLIGLGG